MWLTVITNPTRQSEYRGPRPTRAGRRVANTAEHQAKLAGRLTPRDKWLARMLHEHRVLTTPQITQLAFPSERSAQQRLRELYRWQVTDRFQPLRTHGTAPHHHVLGPAGATVLAAEDGVDIKDLGYRHDRALGIAHSLRLAHTTGVNDWFTALAARGRRSRAGALLAWWSESRCARHWGDLVRPDGYGRWQHNDATVEFFVEYDLGTEPLTKVANKLTGYAQLATATAITTPILIWLPTHRRETTTRRLLTRVWNDLDHPDQVPVATAAADLLNPNHPHPSPADPVWLPLTPTRAGRYALHQLPDPWPHLTPPTASTPPSNTGQAPPPSPTPPLPSPAGRPRE